MAKVSIFVSHNYQDVSFCTKLATALQKSDADVWYSSSKVVLNDSVRYTGSLMIKVQQELEARPIFIVILSKSSISSSWVRDEILWAYNLCRSEPTRIILPVVIDDISDKDLNGANGLLFLRSIKRLTINQESNSAHEDLIAQILHILALTDNSMVDEKQGLAERLIEFGKALIAQNSFQDALPFFQCCVQLATKPFEGWYNLAYTYSMLRQYDDALKAVEISLEFNPIFAKSWSHKGYILNKQKRFLESLQCCDKALSIDDNLPFAWSNKAYALMKMGENEEALICANKALQINPSDSAVYYSKGIVLFNQKRMKEASDAFSSALQLEPTNNNVMKYLSQIKDLN